jgi:crotonobetainyl-CoA:carnitine CoA-transferase CaiB-like acyl-CoA transferase
VGRDICTFRGGVAKPVHGHRAVRFSETSVRDRSDRQRYQPELDAIIVVDTRTRSFPVARLQAQRPSSAVFKGSELLADPHLNARGFWDTVEHREVGYRGDLALAIDQVPETPPRLPRAWRAQCPGFGRPTGLERV